MEEVGCAEGRAQAWRDSTFTSVPRWKPYLLCPVNPKTGWLEKLAFSTAALSSAHSC